MVDFTAPDLQRAQANVSPLAPVRDDSTARAIEAISGAAVEGVKTVAVANLQQDVRALEQEFVQDEPEFTQDEINEVSDFRQKMDMLQQASAQRGRTREFRTRAEALLKERSAALPGLTNEFRRAASGILGFDPTGETLRQEMADADRQEAAIQEQLQFYDDDAVRSFGFLPGDVYKPEKQGEYIARAAVRNRISELQDLAQLNKLTGGLVGGANVSQKLFKDAPGIRDNNSAEISGQIVRTINDSIGSDIQSISDVTATELGQLSEEQRNALRLSITDAGRRALDSYLPMRPEFKNESEWRLFADTVTAPYQDAINAIDDEQALKRFQQGQELVGSMYAAGIADTETGKLVAGLGALNLPLTNLLQTKKGVELINAMSGYIAKSPEDPKPAPGKDQIDADSTKALTSDLQDWINSSKEDGNIDQQALGQAVMNYAELLDEGSTRGYDKNTMRALVDGLINPDISAYTKDTLKQNAFVARKAARGLTTHAQKLANTANQKLARFDRATIDGERVPPVNFVINDEGFIDVAFNEPAMARLEEEVRQATSPFPTITPTGALGFDPATSLIPPNEADIVALQRGTIQPLNDAVTALVELFGVTRQEAVSRVLEGTPYADLTRTDDQGSEGNDE